MECYNSCGFCFKWNLVCIRIGHLLLSTSTQTQVSKMSLNSTSWRCACLLSFSKCIWHVHLVSNKLLILHIGWTPFQVQVFYIKKLFYITTGLMPSTYINFNSFLPLTITVFMVYRYTGWVLDAFMRYFSHLQYNTIFIKNFPSCSKSW